MDDEIETNFGLRFLGLQADLKRLLPDNLFMGSGAVRVAIVEAVSFLAGELEIAGRRDELPADHVATGTVDPLAPVVEPVAEPVVQESAAAVAQDTGPGGNAFGVDAAQTEQVQAVNVDHPSNV